MKQSNTYAKKKKKREREESKEKAVDLKQKEQARRDEGWMSEREGEGIITRRPSQPRAVS
jgi:hypothetical protein